MTVETTLNREQYATNGTAGPWTVGFYFLEDSHLGVTYADAAGNETLLVLNVGYSVAGAGDPNGGTVTTTTAYAAGGTITILRSVPALQGTDYVESESFPAESHERALDWLTMIAGQQAEALQRTLTFPVSDNTSGLLPGPDDRADRILAFDASGAPSLIVGVNSGSASSLALDLLNAVSSVKGAALVAWNYALTYLKGAVGSVGWALNLFQPKTNLWTYLSDAQLADVQSGTTPTLDCSAAFDALWTAVKTTGGRALIPAGNYLLNSQWNLTRTSPVNIKIQATGAVFYAGAGVTGSHVQINGSYNFSSLKIEGLQFNHRNNTTAQGCFELKNAHAVTLLDCNVEMHNTKANWYFAKLATSTPGASENDFNSFWTKILGCSTRMRSGGDGTVGAYGIILEGTANATTIRDCILSSLNVGIRMNPGPTLLSMQNAALIERNHFETIATAAIEVNATPAQLGPTGLVVAFNRVESCPTFFSFFTGGAAATQHSQPPLLLGNYCTTGSVTNWVLNPTGYNISVLETRSPGFGPAFENHWYMAGGMNMYFATGGGLTIGNVSGAGDYATGRFKQSSYTYWTNTGVGKFYVKATAPANNTDGTVVGTQV